MNFKKHNVPLAQKNGQNIRKTREQGLARNRALLGYGLLGLTFGFGITIFINLYLNYQDRDKLKNTIASTHIEWQIRTFYYFFGLMLLGIITAYFDIGYLIIFGAVITLSVRILWGSVKLFFWKPV